MSCLACAASDAHAHVISSAEALSAEYLFYHAVQNMPEADPSRGTSLTAISKALFDNGQPPESAWPYLTDQPAPADWHPPSCKNELHFARLDTTKTSPKDIATLIRTAGPVLLGLVVTDAFYMCDHQGNIPDLAPDPPRAAHAVLAVGYGGSDGQHILIRNSWGSSWGDQGHGWLPPSYLSRQLAEAAIVISKETK
ncbi:hypothetical protein HY26_08305 [Hyphomonas sp. GM-8P]|nr:hypothetical protein HY26_08305 [Hyphomonas sp. GM-8P]|tara:strand:+ start:25242 stop:25829 length:588 start_codon:yes stop_codon:yes gene_type:complete